MKPIIGQLLIAVVFLVLLLLFAPLPVAAIFSGDIGSEAISQGMAWSSNYTVINLNHPCEFNGLITHVQIYLYANSQCPTTDVTVATFYNEGGGHYTARDYETLASVPCGYSEESVSLEVHTGDFIGYSTPANGGSVCTADTGGSGLMYGTANAYLTGNYTYYVHNATAVLSLSGTGVETVTGLAIGETTGATEITAHSAVLNARCVWDGNSTASALFMWGSLMQDGNYTYGTVITGETFSHEITGLIPDSEYGYWIVLTNDSGDFWSTPVMLFDTLTTTEIEVPYVITDVATDIGNSTAIMHGRVAYDGNLDCFVGFQYRVYGSGTWINGWNDMYLTHNWLPWHTGDTFSASLSNLQPKTSYEFRAQVKNTLGTGYGDIKVFTTGYGMYVQPTPTGGVGFWEIIPDSIKHYFKNWNPMLKMILAIILTVGGMAVLAVKTSRAKASGLAVGAYGGLATIGFLIVGWYPQWVLILLGAVVGLLLLLIILGGRK